MAFESFFLVLKILGEKNFWDLSFFLGVCCEH
jgi:hypothetical protein